MLAMLYATGNFLIWDSTVPSPPSKGQDYFAQPINLTRVWSGKLLTASALYSNADVKAQPENICWSGQEWEIGIQEIYP